MVTKPKNGLRDSNIFGPRVLGLGIGIGLFFGPWIENFKQRTIFHMTGPVSVDLQRV